jgi:hypothetical protein
LSVDKYKSPGLARVLVTMTLNPSVTKAVTNVDERQTIELNSELEAASAVPLGIFLRQLTKRCS